jgi:hypothetical protein
VFGFLLARGRDPKLGTHRLVLVGEGLRRGFIDGWIELMRDGGGNRGWDSYRYILIYLYLYLYILFYLLYRLISPSCSHIRSKKKIEKGWDDGAIEGLKIITC